MIWIKAACLCRRRHWPLPAAAASQPKTRLLFGSLTLGLLCGKLQCWTTWSSSAKSNFVLFFRLRGKLGSLIRKLVRIFYDWIMYTILFWQFKNWFWTTSNFVIYGFCSAFKNESLFSLLSPKAIFYIVCKVHIFWEGHNFLRNLHLSFVLCSAS